MRSSHNEPQQLCLCNQYVGPGIPSESVLKCVNPRCQGLYHKFCLKIYSHSEDYPLFECPSCTLLKSDPLHQVLRILVPPFVLDNQRKEFLVDKSTYENIRAYDNLGIEVRSIKLEDKVHDQCWPNTGELILNQQRFLDFRPLQQNSSLKKRKDEKFFTREVKQGPNYFYLKFIKLDPRIHKTEETIVAAIYLVRRLSCEELVQKIKRENKREIEECKKMIAADFQGSGLDIDKLSYPLTCVFDMQLLKTPAKGVHCKHINCFSLENYVSVWQKNTQRRWVCPICKAKAYDIVVDTYFEKIMKELYASAYEDKSQVTIEINRDTTYKFIKDDTSSELDDEDKPVQKPTKSNNKAPEKAANIVVLDESDEEPSISEAQSTSKMTVEQLRISKPPFTSSEAPIRQALKASMNADPKATKTPVRESAPMQFDAFSIIPPLNQSREKDLSPTHLSDIFQSSTIHEILDDSPTHSTGFDKGFKSIHEQLAAEIGYGGREPMEVEPRQQQLQNPQRRPQQQPQPQPLPQFQPQQQHQHQQQQVFPMPQMFNHPPPQQIIQNPHPHPHFQHQPPHQMPIPPMQQMQQRPQQFIPQFQQHPPQSIHPQPIPGFPYMPSLQPQSGPPFSMPVNMFQWPVPMYDRGPPPNNNQPGIPGIPVFIPQKQLDIPSFSPFPYNLKPNQNPNQNPPLNPAEKPKTSIVPPPVLNSQAQKSTNSSQVKEVNKPREEVSKKPATEKPKPVQAPVQVQAQTQAQAQEKRPKPIDPVDEHEELRRRLNGLLDDDEILASAVEKLQSIKSVLDVYERKSDKSLAKLVNNLENVGPFAIIKPAQVVPAKKVASKEFVEETEKNIERLTEYCGSKLELPSFGNFKSKKYAEADIDKETSLQRSQKLISVAMKHIPLQTTRPAKDLKGMEVEEDHSPIERPSVSPRNNMLNGNMQVLMSQFQPQAQGPKKGNVMDPICLD